MTVRNIFLTGVPRSGSTLFLKLLSENSPMLCLDEPTWLKNVRKNSLTKTQAAKELLLKTASLRNDINESKVVELTLAKGTTSIPENHFQRTTNHIVRKTKHSQLTTVSKDFLNFPLVIKSNIFFTAIIPELLKIDGVSIIATIRNPIATIKSWRSLNVSLSKGVSKIAENYSTLFDQNIHNESSVLKRQVLILDWIFEVYYKFQESIQIFPYERFIQNPSLIEVVHKSIKINPCLKFESKNDNPNYNHEEDELIRSELLKNGRYFKHFYQEL